MGKITLDATLLTQAPLCYSGIYASSYSFARSAASISLTKTEL